MHGVSRPTLTLLLQAGQVMYELLDGRSSLHRQSRGGLIVHRGDGGEQLVGATQQRAGLPEERGDLLGGVVAGRVKRRHRGESDPFRTPPLPASPENVALYLANLAEAGAKASTIQRRLLAISQAHQLAGHVPSPTQDWMVRATMSGIRRTIGTAPAKKVAAVTAELRRLVEVCPVDTLAGCRDRAVLLLGFAGAFRRLELVSLDVDDLGETADGLRLQLRQSKGPDGE